ncbi:hypothetical protein NKG05_00580 [Oerskovia sp. M15]
MVDGPVGSDTLPPQAGAALAARASETAPTDPASAAALYEQASAAFEADGTLDEAGFALAEAAQLAAMEQDLDGSLAVFPEPSRCSAQVVCPPSTAARSCVRSHGSPRGRAPGRRTERRREALDRVRGISVAGAGPASPTTCRRPRSTSRWTARPASAASSRTRAHGSWPRWASSTAPRRRPRRSPRVRPRR